MSQESSVHAGPEEKTMGRSSHRGAILQEDYLSSGAGWSDSSTAGTTSGNPAAGTGSADALAIIAKRSGGGGGWRYTDAPVQGTRSMIGLDRSHEKIVSS